MKFAVVLIALATAAQAQAPAAPKTPPTAAAGSTAPASEDPEAARRLFRHLDRNGDGYLTSEELWAMRGRDDNWAAVDRNRDGRISPEEFTVLRRR
jgi:Ca2+-binding EF-hand superfamily protein